jgi:hypothetical protein
MPSLGRLYLSSSAACWTPIGSKPWRFTRIPAGPLEHDGFVISALDAPLPQSDKAPMKTSSARERIHISICIID